MGRLIVVPTPIGNLEDMTFRGVRVLREARLVLAEDTRHTKTLLARYEITARLLSYHAHNRRSRLQRILTELEQGDVALVSDAGMPGLSDPGSDLIAELIRRDISVEVLPGASAVPTAAVLSGFSGSGFLFVGFLPRARGERDTMLSLFTHLPYPLVIFEAPSRTPQTLQDLQASLGDREAVVARELTKVYEEVARGRLSHLHDVFAAAPPRGEIVIVVSGAQSNGPDRAAEAGDIVKRLRHEGIQRTSALRMLVDECGVSRNTAYRLWLESEEIDNQA